MEEEIVKTREELRAELAEHIGGQYTFDNQEFDLVKAGGVAGMIRLSRIAKIEAKYQGVDLESLPEQEQQEIIINHFTQTDEAVQSMIMPYDRQRFADSLVNRFPPIDMPELSRISDEINEILSGSDSASASDSQSSSTPTADTSLENTSVKPGDGFRI